MTMTEHPAQDTYGTPPPLTMLDGLMSDLNEHPALNDTVDLPVPTRDGWAIRCNTDIGYEELQVWRKAAVDPDMAVGVNELKLACTILVSATSAVLLEGEPVTVDGEPVTFNSPHLQGKLGVTRPQDAVRKLFGRDGYVTAASTALIREAGFGSEATPIRR
jgi:hypothetical protein